MNALDNKEKYKMKRGLNSSIFWMIFLVSWISWGCLKTEMALNTWKKRSIWMLWPSLSSIKVKSSIYWTIWDKVSLIHYNKRLCSLIWSNRKKLPISNTIERFLIYLLTISSNISIQKCKITNLVTLLLVI